MKSKTLMTMAIVSTFGWSAAAFAGSSDEVRTPLSVNESGEVIVSSEPGFTSKRYVETVGASSHQSASGSLSGSYGSQSASPSLDESIALADEGIYTDFYVVSWSPASVGSWDYYVIGMGDMNDFVALDDSSLLMPTHELALIPSTSEERVYELALVPLTFDSMSDHAMGE